MIRGGMRRRNDFGRRPGRSTRPATVGPDSDGGDAMAPSWGRRLAAGMLVTGLVLGLAGSRGRGDEPPAGAPGSTDADDPTAAPRKRMVTRHLAERGIKDARVLDAFRTVPRHRFLPPKIQRQAYDDESVPIGEGQTLTPPFDVAFMTEALRPRPTDKVYEVGTGSGYQASILSRLVKDVYSVEIHKSLSERATALIKDLGYDNVHTRWGDGYAGWPEAAPFDAIIVTCAPEFVPQPLVDQLKEGGRMVIPVGDRFNQVVHLMVKKDGKLIDRELRPTLFVPMTGKAQREAAAKRKEGDKP